jgi:hypothetical protein
MSLCKAHLKMVPASRILQRGSTWRMGSSAWIAAAARTSGSLTNSCRSCPCAARRRHRVGWRRGCRAGDCGDCLNLGIHTAARLSRKDARDRALTAAGPHLGAPQSASPVEKAAVNQRRRRHNSSAVSSSAADAAATAAANLREPASSALIIDSAPALGDAIAGRRTRASSSSLAAPGQVWGSNKSLNATKMRPLCCADSTPMCSR